MEYFQETAQAGFGFAPCGETPAPQMTFFCTEKMAKTPKQKPRVAFEQDIPKAAPSPPHSTSLSPSTLLSSGICVENQLKFPREARLGALERGAVAGEGRKQPRNSLRLHRTNPGFGWAEKGPGGVEYAESGKGERNKHKNQGCNEYSKPGKGCAGKKKIFLLLLGRATF